MSSLTERDRVWQAIRHTQPDRVPYHISYTTPARRMLERHFGTADLESTLGNHLAAYRASPPEEAGWLEDRPGFWRDEWATVWNRSVDSDIGVVAGYQLQSRSLAGLHIPDPLAIERYSGLPGFIAENANRFRFVDVGFGLFERAWSLRGMSNLMVDMIEAPQFVEELLDEIAYFHLAVVREMVSYDIDAVLFGDDWGQQRGLLFSPRLWRRFIKPRIAQLYRVAAEAGKAVMIHSCGRVQELFPDLIEVGVNVFNPFQSDVMDPYETKRQYGHVLSFYGGMSVQQLLPHGSPAQVRDEALRLMDEVGKGGGFIIGPTHDLPSDIPLENILALIDAVRGE